MNPNRNQNMNIKSENRTPSWCVCIWNCTLIVNFARFYEYECACVCSICICMLMCTWTWTVYMYVSWCEQVRFIYQCVSVYMCIVYYMFYVDEGRGRGEFQWVRRRDKIYVLEEGAAVNYSRVPRRGSVIMNFYVYVYVYQRKGLRWILTECKDRATWWSWISMRMCMEEEAEVNFSEVRRRGNVMIMNFHVYLLHLTVRNIWCVYHSKWYENVFRWSVYHHECEWCMNICL